MADKVHIKAERILERQTGRIFANVFLADEVKRPAPKTQYTPLAAMEAHAISGGKTIPKAGQSVKPASTRRTLAIS